MIKLTTRRLFVGGFIAGSLFTVVTAKTYYEAKFQRRLDMLNESDVDIPEHPVEETPEPKSEKPKSINTTMTDEEKARYSEVLKKTNYASAFKPAEKPVDIPTPPKEVKQEGDTPSEGAIYTISMKDFVERTAGYDQTSLTYFADGTTVNDEFDEVDIMDIANDIIRRTLDDLGDNEAIYVRNEREQMEYDIRKDYRDFEVARNES